MGGICLHAKLKVSTLLTVPLQLFLLSRLVLISLQELPLQASFDLLKRVTGFLVPEV